MHPITMKKGDDFMYKVIAGNSSKVDVLNGEKILLRSISPRLEMEDGTTYEFEQASEFVTNQNVDSMGTYTDYCVKYDKKDENGNTNVEACITFRCYEDRMCVFVKASRKNVVFMNKQTFKAFKGIKLVVESLNNAEGIMANYLYCDWWTRPFFTSNIGDIPARTQAMLWKNNGMYAFVLPVCDKEYKTELEGSDGKLEIQLSAGVGGYNQCDTLSFVLAAGQNPFELPDKAEETAFKAMGKKDMIRKNRKFPDILEYFGWCTWDAFYKDVNEQGILEKAEEFKQKGLPVKWVIIDDGWSKVQDGCLSSFKEDNDKFPAGLAKLSSKLKNEYSFSWVGVWHAFTGYWEGIHPESELACEMKECLAKANSGKIVPAFEKGKAFKFWNAWHSYLKSCGIDFVKVDNQGSLRNHSAYFEAIGKAAENAHDGLEASIGINFDNCVINCMGMSTENIFSRPISSVSRNSDDFYPKKENGFREHALQNAYNSFYHGSIIWGDWDMWWTNHESALNSSLLRAVSGGPVYVSDRVGETDAEKIKPLIFSDGKVLRCEQPGLPTEDCLITNPREKQIPLKIWNMCKGVAYEAAFNINDQGDSVAGKISPKDIPVFSEGQYVAYDYFNKKPYVVSYNDSISFALTKDSSLLYMIAPFDDDGISLLGLIDKYISSAGIEEVIKLNNVKTAIILKEGGIFAFAARKSPSKVLANAKNIEYNCIDGVFYQIDCSQHKKKVIVEIYH